jgi:hypothetical protein
MDLAVDYAYLHWSIVLIDSHRDDLLGITYIISLGGSSCHGKLHRRTQKTLKSLVGTEILSKPCVLYAIWRDRPSIKGKIV